MKTLIFDKDDILPIILLACSTFLINFGVFLFGAFSTVILLFFAYEHIFLVYRQKLIKYLSIFKIIKYSIFVLIFNTIFCFIALCIATNGLKAIFKLTFDNFHIVGLKFLLIGLLFLSFFTFIAKKNDKANKKLDTKYYKFAPIIITVVFLICNLSLFILFKNFVDLLFGLLIVIPYIWYVTTFAVKIQKIEIQEQLG